MTTPRDPRETLIDIEMVMTSFDWSDRREAHAHHELVCPLESGYRVEVGGRVVVAAPGEVLCYPAGTAHRPRLRRHLEHRLLLLKWDDARAGHDDDRVLVVRDTRGRLLAGLRWLLDTDPAERTVRGGLLRAILHEHRRLSRAANREPRQGAGDTDADLAARIDRYLSLNFFRPLNLDELALLEKCSTRHLLRRYRSATGSTPMRTLQRLRVDTALDLLRSSDLTLAAIAERVGFGSAEHLSRLIRRQTGTTARSLRAG